MRAAPSHRLDPENEENTMIDWLYKPSVKISSSSLLFPLVRYMLIATGRVASILKQLLPLGQFLDALGSRRLRLTENPSQHESF